MAARQSYGKLVAWLTARCGDLAAAEDALSEAFLAALDSWPRQGVPDSPEAWLLVAARRRWIDGHRRAHTQERLLTILGSEEATMPADPADEEVTIPDDRLRLLFLCAHPAIDPAIQAPLMLQTVLGLSAAGIGAAFLVAPATMGQRLVRAKARIRDAGIPFVQPAAAVLHERAAAVLEAIYAAYTAGWDDPGGTDPGTSDRQRRDLAEEAVALARLCAALLPKEPEARGLLALLLHCQARRRARRGPRGAYVPLLEQDTSLWSAELIEAAERELAQAASAGRPGRFQLEAAIQSVHARRAVTGTVDWAALVQLYGGLIRIAPSTGAVLGHAAALAELEGPAVGLARLDALAAEAHTAEGLGDHQPWWALRAHLLKRCGKPQEAAEAYGRAIALAEDPAVRSFLRFRAGQHEAPTP